MCTFNGAKFVSEQLESVARQNHAVDELIVCDDASTDETIRIVQTFAATAPFPVRLEINDRQLSPTQNFSKAISHCRGDLIFLCDQDDRWRPEKVQILAQSFQNDAIGLAFSNAKLVREDGTVGGQKFWESIWFNAAERQKIEQGDAVPVLLHHAIVAGATMAFRAKYRPLILPIPDLPRSHDIWIALLIACAGRIAAVDEDLIDYRQHSSNQIGAPAAGLIGQIRMARHQIKVNAFQLAADLHIAADERLRSQYSQWPISARSLKLLREKIEHTRTRHNLPGWPAKLKIIGGEWRRGNYAKYSYGFKSVLQDLFLR